MASERNQIIFDFFKNAAETGKLSHGYLFWGGGEEMKKAAFWLAEFLKTDPFDILYLSVLEDKKEISINQIKQIKKHLSLSSYSGLYKFAIIDKAETMARDASDALLKTLEEPQGKTILILLAPNPDLLPKTIISRLQDIRFQPAALNKISENIINKEHIGLLQKPLNDIFKAIEKISKEETEIFPLLDSWLFWFREKLINKNETKYLKTIQEIQKTKELISTSNINKRLALENLILCIKN